MWAVDGDAVELAHALQASIGEEVAAPTQTCVESFFRHNRARDGVGTCVATLVKLMKNISDSPAEPKFRRIRTSNAAIASKVLSFSGSRDILLEAGFVAVDGGEALQHPGSDEGLTALRDVFVAFVLQAEHEAQLAAAASKAPSSPATPATPITTTGAAAPPSSAAGGAPGMGPQPGDWQEACSRAFFGDASIVQPKFKHVLGGELVCYGCMTMCQSHVASDWVPELAPAPFACQCRNLGGGRMCVLEGRSDMVQGAARTAMQTNLAQAVAMMRAREGGSTGSRPQAPPARATVRTANPQFFSRLQGVYGSVMQYEDPAMQAMALSVIPVENLKERAINSPDPRPSERDELVYQLTLWFKHEFFQWTNSPACEKCLGETQGIGGANPTTEEQRYGAGRVEIYRCKNAVCQAVTRFPRYNHPGKLMSTKCGRCGEWANAFALCCRAMGFDTRQVLDWTDHVWVEVYSEYEQRWVHIDPCEAVMDKPMVYEAGWGKKLSYVFGISRDGFVDVVRRYTQNFANVATRRTEVDEQVLADTLNQLNSAIMARVPADRQALLMDRARKEAVELMSGTRAQLSAEEQQGRVSGSAAWRASRGETGGSGGGSGSGSGEAAAWAPKTWLITEDAVPPGSKEWVLGYHTASDSYVVGGQGQKTKGWRTGVHAASNIKYYVETDWNMVYLSREHDRDASITWHVKWAQLGRRLAGVSFKGFHHVFGNNARVRWELSPDGNQWAAATQLADPETTTPADVFALLMGIPGASRDLHQLYIRATLTADPGHTIAPQILRTTRTNYAEPTMRLALSFE